MNRIEKTFIAVFAAAIAVSASVSAAAQTSDDYQPSMRPGLSIYVDQDSSSMLSKAARDGVSVVIGGERGTTEPAEDTRHHAVREGDTLWDICTKYFGDPYVWPRIWSYNTKITNPNWIYPGEIVWLVAPPSVPVAPAAMPAEPSGPVVRRAPDAVLVRNRGFVDKEVLEQSGKVVGAQKEIMMLAQHDEAYADFGKNADVRTGDEFSAYEVVREVEGLEDTEQEDEEIGKLVEILGVVRVTSFDAKTGIARVVIDESLKPITRGTLVGPVHRRFDLVAPVQNDHEVKGHIVAFLDPTILAASHQIVFVDKGSDEGVREGNRFFSVEKRDNWRESLDEEDDHDGYPFEVLAEMRVIEVRPNTSTCLVTASTRELEVGSEVEMVEGY